MDIIHQIDGGGQTGNTTADDVGVAGFDSFRCVCVVLQIIDFHNSCSLYYRVVVIKAPLQGLCYTVRDAVDWFVSPTARRF